MYNKGINTLAYVGYNLVIKCFAEKQIKKRKNNKIFKTPKKEMEHTRFGKAAHPHGFRLMPLSKSIYRLKAMPIKGLLIICVKGFSNSHCTEIVGFLPIAFLFGDLHAT